MCYYLLRVIPEVLFKYQNNIYGPSDKLFKSMEKSYASSLNNVGDVKEVIPEFYNNSTEILINVHEAELTAGEPIEDVELPLWCRDASHFCETLRDCLESDVVSASLHLWIDLVFGFKQRGDAALRADNWFPDESYMVDWYAVKNSTEKEARETLIKQFGQVPGQLFITPHHQRVFRIAPNPDAPLNSNTSKVLKDTIFELERQIQLMTKSYSQELQFTQEHHNKEKASLSLSQSKEITKLQSKISMLDSSSISKLPTEKEFLGQLRQLESEYERKTVKRLRKLK